MQQLRFTAVHEDGQHLVLTDPRDGAEYLVEVDERLRDAVRGRRRGVAERPAEALTPRTVQAMMRAGDSAEEVAAATGWPVERVQRYEAPILAEREHVATLARGAEVRGRAADGAERPTLESRVRERLTARGVDPDLVRWDASRPEGGSWTVLVGFVAGNRDRRAAWRFDPAARHLEALDDEARWLSEDEQALPGGAGGYAGLGGDGTGAVDLVATMRRRSQARGRRRGRSGAATQDPADVPGREEVPEELLPLAELRYDPATHGLPPAAHPHPGAPPEPGEPEPEQTTGGSPVVPADAEVPAEAPDPDEQGEHDEEEVDTSPQEATLADLFGGDLEDEDVRLEEQADYHDEAGEPGEPDQDDEYEPGEYEPEHHETDREDLPAGEGPAGRPEDHSQQDAGPALAAVPDPDPAEEVAEPGTPDRTGQDGPGRAVEEDPGGRPTGTGSRAGSRRRGRPSVPSWDDIMFGARDQR